MSEQGTTIIVRRVRRKRAGHHGGAWKVAYADFVTAMMAFFLVMWLVGAGSNEQKAAISRYFKNPSALSGQSVTPAMGSLGPGGASNSLIKLGGAMEIPRGPGDRLRDAPKPAASAAAEQAARAAERQRLESLMQELRQAMDSSQALKPFKDQLLLDITPEGLRIQIVDKQNRPMFDLGSARLKAYTAAILQELAGFLNEVPNRISISGHTDVVQYSRDDGYGNWELSADRANAARRTLVAAGMRDDRVARVVGLGASVLFDKTDPRDPVNRRIAIIVMTRQAEQTALDSEEAPARRIPAPPASEVAALSPPPPAAPAAPPAFSTHSAAPR
ncbi:flagellar motor protein [Mizugakiibacter sediminis]|uniref:Flagellar motor protein n=1 Tax=Mizugakiibacter sediminis TaxID=1475481 RepID=A0A0K8QPC8_9GAMM|nr:flagellar motor protein MotB [Mizugakiibacter sediminis]GAP66744.1 flagellar motor protein [Mizugakiibacter sediminis]